ncbi:hypothetical protein PGB90_009473 [Kerria lacca]
MESENQNNENRIVAHNSNSNFRNENAVDGAPPPGNAEAQRPPSRFESFISITKTLIVRALIIYFISNFFRGKQPATVHNSTDSGHVTKLPAVNYFRNGTFFDMYLFVSESPLFVDFNDPNSLIWEKNGLVYGDWSAGMNGDGIFTNEVEIIPNERIKNNGSIYIHTYLVKWDKPRENLEQLLSLKDDSIVHSSKRLNKYKKRFFVKTQNLLTGETATSKEDIEKAKRMNSEIVSHWHPNLTICLITDQTEWTQGMVPSPINEYIEFLSDEDQYKPVIFYNDFWNMKRDYHPINETVKTLRLSLTYQPISLFKWQIYLAQATRSKWSMNMYGDTDSSDSEDEEQDSLKEMLLETNPYLIAATVIVSVLHSVFELLAFKNDIQFWNNRESLEGLSVRSVMFNVFQSVIVFLYVLDNEANMIITISCFIGLLIEIWKINKVIDFSLDRQQKIFNLFPKIIIKDKGSYVESSTKEYDQLAFKYLSWILFPLLAGYACYSLLYQEHKGWYSWILNMFYSFLLTFGFIMMTPQLFINYKLKSVAHLPWRMMSYKFLNTFIDDIFAFVIKMPTMYRIGCLRDDVVFFIFLYQRWIYKTDPTRINEFGYSAEMEQQHLQQKDKSKIAIADSSSVNGEAVAVKTDNAKKED